MYEILKVGAIVVVDFLLAIGLFALWKMSGRIVPPPTPKDGTGGKETS